MRRHSLLPLALLLASLTGGRALADGDCGRPGDSPGRFGPFDYRAAGLDQERWLVESAHFTLYMEDMALYGFSSRQARTGGSGEEAAGWSLVGGNLDYTLYAFPNHSRALYAMAIWQERTKKEDPIGLQGALQGSRMLPAECYFQRAVGYTPDDPLVFHAYGAYLQKIGQLTKAADQYKRAIELNPNAPEPHYNLGLLYFQLGDYANASLHADRAYALGYPLPGLKRKLASVGRAAN